MKRLKGVMLENKTISAVEKLRGKRSFSDFVRAAVKNAVRGSDSRNKQLAREISVIDGEIKRLKRDRAEKVYLLEHSKDIDV